MSVPDGDIGVVVALAAEAVSLCGRRLRPGSVCRVGRLRVIVSGVGGQRAGAAAARLLDNDVSALLSWGIAGGLASSLQPGRLLLPDRMCSADREIRVDADWHARLARRLQDAGVPFETGPLWTHSGVASTLAEKRKLATRGCIAVDMEAIDVAHSARRAGVPFAAIKCICDPAQRCPSAVARGLLHDDGSIAPWALLLALARGPRVWWQLRSMQQDFSAARRGLRRAADAWLGDRA